MVPPLPIPNREVKRFSAYDTNNFGTIGHCQKFWLTRLDLIRIIVNDGEKVKIEITVRAREIE
jgi:hypothetical protein